MRWRFGTLLAGVALLAAAASAVVVERPEELAAALRGTELVHLKLSRAELPKDQLEPLQQWVANGGALWTETDAAELFGFTTVKVTERERTGHARRACAVGASGLVSGVEHLFFRLAPNGVLLTGHPGALPLLKLADPVVRPRGVRYVAAQVYYGRGQVIHAPGSVHPTRADGQAWLSDLQQVGGQTADEVTVPIETLAVAHRNATEAAERFRLNPEAAKQSLNQTFLAFRLWYADYLTTARQFDEARDQLAAVAAALPDDPAVYLGVARLNEALGRTLPAQEARDKAAAAYKALKREPPGPDAPQIRVPWSAFVECINRVGAAWDNPTKETAEDAAGRTAFLMAEEAYRRSDLKAAEELWTDAAKRCNQWPLALFRLGQLNDTRGLEPRQPNRDRIALLGRAAQLFQAASRGATSEGWSPEAAKAAQSWMAVVNATAQQPGIDPPGAEVTDHFIIRYDDTDRRLQVGPLLNSIALALNQSYELLTAWGIWLDETEVILYPDALALRNRLPATGVSRMAFSYIAAEGRRLHAVARATDIGQMSRHELSHVLVSALTEGGYPAPLWVDEGLATGMERSPTKSQYALTNIHRGRALTIPQLNNPEFFYRRDVVDQGYGQSQLMLEALVKRFGPEILVTYLQAVGWGESADAAFQRLTGVTQEEFLALFIQGRLGPQ